MRADCHRAINNNTGVQVKARLVAQALAVSLGWWTGAENRKAEGLREFPAEEKDFFSVNIIIFSAIGSPELFSGSDLGNSEWLIFFTSLVF